jgi:hypothetical protein
MQHKRRLQKFTVSAPSVCNLHVLPFSAPQYFQRNQQASSNDHDRESVTLTEQQVIKLSRLSTLQP